MKRFECRIGKDGEWWVMNDECVSAIRAAHVFAEFMINHEWKTYDLEHADKMAASGVQVRFGEDGDVHEYRVTHTSLKLDVGVEHVRVL